MKIIMTLLGLFLVMLLALGVLFTMFFSHGTVKSVRFSEPHQGSVQVSTTRSSSSHSPVHFAMEIEGHRSELTEPHNNTINQAKAGVEASKAAVENVRQKVLMEQEKVRQMAQIAEIQRASRNPGIIQHSTHVSYRYAWSKIALIFGIIGVLSLLFLLLLAVFVMRAARGSGSDRQTREEDSRLAQELYDLQKKLEKRVESLETIILDEMKTE